MARSPLSTPKFRNLFAGCWIVWALLHFQLVRWYGFSVKTAAVDSIVGNVLLLGVCLLITMILQFYLPQKHRYSFLLGLCGMLTVGWLFSSSALTLLLVQEPSYRHFYWNAFPARIAVGFLVIGCMTLINVLWYVLGDQQEAERRRRDAEQASKEAELYKLRQQLQPHFLFNSLNSINALVSLNPALARTMIQQLSDFLRGTIKREENTWVKLEEELQHLQLYLDIEKVRFGHRLQTEVQNEAVEKNVFLPAMLLQPIVENAIKFGLYDTTGEVVITITATIKNNTLFIEVRNPFDAETTVAARGTGFGLSSVQRRLHLLFGRTDLLETASENNHFITTIKIPQRDKSDTDR